MKHLEDSNGINIFSNIGTKSTSLQRKAPGWINSLSRFLGMRKLSLGLAVAALFVGFVLLTSIFEIGGSVAALGESIGTFQSSDCSTPKSEWNLGQTACAVVSGGAGARRIVWVAPDGNVAHTSNSFNENGSDTYTLLTTGPFAQYGTWTVVSMDNRGTGYAGASFLVHPTTASVDLQVLKFGPDEAFAGSSISYTIQLTNKGPDTAANVVLSEPVPANTTFLSEAQTSGTPANCTNPSVGNTGTSTCTIASMAPGSTAIFTFAYTVNSNAPVGTLISNAATVSSSTAELFQPDNTARYQTAVGPNPPPSPCTLTCPGDVSASTTTCTAVVTYSTPTTSGNCDTVACSPASGSTFPIGQTLVTCSTQSGGECSFTVTVTGNDTTAPVITCPADITTPEDPPSSGAAQVGYVTPTATDNCTRDVQVTCSPPTGTSFPLGSTTVTCTATDASNNTGSCTFTVTVSAAACALTCPDNINDAATNGCTKIVTYPSPTQSGSCGFVTCEPFSGSAFPVGTNTVVCTATDTSGNTITTCSFTVNITGGTLACPADISTTENPPNSGFATVFYTEPSPCSGSPVTCSPPSGSAFPVGTTSVTCTNSESCTFTVTVSASSCAINCPPNKTVNNDTNQCGAVVTYGAPTLVGNCGSDPPTCEPPSGAFFPVGSTTVVCSSSRSGVQCTFSVTVIDNTPPIAICRNITVNLGATGSVTVSAADIDNGSNDSCGITQLLIDGAATKTLSCANKGANTVTLTVKDPSNNTATCTATVTVVDNISPTITCPANMVKEPTCPTGAKTLFTPTANDNCPGVTTACNPPSGSVFPIGTTTVTCTATDTSNLTATCTFTVRVKTSAETVQDMINRVLALQPPLSGQQVQGLISKLQAALDAINDNKTNVACNKLSDFISQVTAFINNGTLTSAQGQPLIDSATNVRNTLGCTSLGCS